MNIVKYRSVKVSERVFDLVADGVNYINEDGNKLCGYLNTFNNCRECGFYLGISDDDFDNKDRVKGSLYVWVFENRNSDNIVVLHQNEITTCNGMFSDEGYENNRKFFNYDEEYKASEYIIKLIKDKFNK